MKKLLSVLLLLVTVSSFGADFYRVKTIDTLNCKMRFYNSASTKIYEIDLTGGIYARGNINEYIINDGITKVTVKSGYLTSPTFTFLDTLLSTSQAHCFNYGGIPQKTLNDSIIVLRGLPNVDTAYKNTGGDSIVFKINGVRKAIIDNNDTGWRGTATLSSGTVTVSSVHAVTGYKIYAVVNTPSGTRGYLSVPSASIVNGVSFVINSTSATEASTVNWWIAP